MTYRTVLAACLFAAFTTAAHAQIAQPTMRLCGRTGIVHEGTIGNDGQFHQTWMWDASKAPGVPAAFVPKLMQIDDCKPSANGKEMLISSSKGGIAIVGYPQGDVRFWAAVPNAHSIELLPNGLVAAASSTNKDGNMLMIFDRNTPDKPLWTMPMEAAHGVTWDAKRGVLWALRHRELLKLNVKRVGSGVQADVLKTYAWGGAGGHDLVLRHDGKQIVATTSSKVIVFDIDAEKFHPYEAFKGMKDIKSVTYAPGTETMAYTQADGGDHWWTSIVHVRMPDAADVAVHLPFEVYKVRWIQR